MKKTILKIDGMTCSACSSGLEKYLLKQDGVQDALVNLVMATASITYDDGLQIEDLNRFVKEAGFKSLGEFDITKENKRDNQKAKLIINGFVLLTVMYTAMAQMLNLPQISFLARDEKPVNHAIVLLAFAVYFLVFGREIIANGLKNIKYKSPNMDTLVTLGVFASFIYSAFNTAQIIGGKPEFTGSLYFESVCMILYLVKLGRYIDIFSKEKTKEAIKGLVTITPKSALIKTGKGEKEAPIDEVVKGDVLIAKPGMKFSVDGEIVNGFAHVDESFITGESAPVKKSAGDKVVAGAVNLDGYVEYKAVKIGRDSTVSQIVRLVVEATNTKVPIARAADKASGIFVYCIMGIALLAFIVNILSGGGINNALITFVTVLVCACPCALGLAAPLAVVVSEGVCAKNGLLVKHSDVLETAAKIDTVVFDKTGTLTYGRLSVSEIYNYSDYSDGELMRIAGSFEKVASHPIAAAFCDYLEQNRIEKYDVEESENLPGRGIKGKLDGKEYLIGNAKLLAENGIKNPFEKDELTLSQSGNSIVYLAEKGDVIGLFGVKDIVRDNAKSVISKLKKLGKQVVMLTGDNETTAGIIAESIGVDSVIANVSPNGKADRIKKLISSENKVMMVGDGINDAPALSVADIGVSLKSGTDIAGDSADVILIKNDLGGIANLFSISRKTLRNIKQNLFWAFFYNICMIPVACGLFAFAGIKMTPMIASIAMTVSSTTVIINALRIKRWKDE